jgi:hypothetical protein
VIDEAYGVFVSPTGNDSEDGTRAKPYRTLAKAFTEAVGTGKRVYACGDGGTFPETITIGASLDGLSVFGGFHCSDWSYDTAMKSKVASADATAWKVSELTKGLTVEDVEITAADASTPGGSSIGMLVSGSDNVHLRRVKITAGKGTSGADGTGTTDLAATGALGLAGTAACKSATLENPGGAAVESQCLATASGSKGGRGGDGGKNDSSAGSGDPGQIFVTGKGLGGGGETNPGWDCNTGGGTVGANGTAGTPGTGASTAGTLSAAGFAPSAGKDGGPGSVAQGGGGGGGAKAPASCPGPDPKPPRSGASGGGGGGGGCGGKGGTGGKSGGASFALVSVDSSVTVDDSELVAQSAGKGGKGGVAQPGGLGGDPGKQAPGAAGALASCDGGRGGQGGNGGPGGGGAGGPSVGIAYVGTAPTQTNVTIQVAAFASGGADGSGSTTGAGAGTAGIAAKVSAL